MTTKTRQQLERAMNSQSHRRSRGELQALVRHQVVDELDSVQCVGCGGHLVASPCDAMCPRCRDKLRTDVRLTKRWLSEMHEVVTTLTQEVNELREKVSTLIADDGVAQTDQGLAVQVKDLRNMLAEHAARKHLP